MPSSFGPGSEVAQGKIKLLSRLGVGGFGEVFLGQTCRGLKAVKVVDTSLWSEKEYKAFNAMLMSEVSFLSTLTHPRLPKFYDLFAEGKHYFLVMDWFKGNTLQEYIESNGPLGLEEVSGVYELLLDVLDYLHRGCEGVVVFGDLKPANIIRTRAGDYRLVDLGLVTKRGAKLSRNIAVFSPNYGAPERASCGASDPAQDLFSLGGTIFFCLTGRVPHADPSPRTQRDLIARSLERFAEDLSEESLRSFGVLLQLSLQGLRSQPYQRPAGIQVLKEAWTQYQSSCDTGTHKAEAMGDIVRSIYREREKE